MKTQKKIEVEGAGGDQDMTTVEVEHCRRKEMKKKKKNSKGLEVDEDDMLANSGERQVEKDKKKDVLMDDMEGNEWKKEEEVKGKKRKNKEEKCNDDKAGKVEKVKKKEKMANVKMFDADEMQVENQQRQKKKKKKKEKKGNVLVGYEDERQVERGKKEKDHMMLFVDKETKVEKKKKKKKKKEKEDVAGNEGRKVESDKEKRRDVKADNQENKIEKEKQKKSKEKEAKDDIIAGNEEQKKVKDKKENKKKDKGGDVKSGKKTIDVHSGNMAENLKAERDARKKRKLDKGDIERKANCEVPKTKKRASSADSSQHLTPESQSKKVRFSDEVKVFPPSNNSTNYYENGDGLVQGKRFSKEEDTLIRKSVSDYIEANQLGKEGLNMVLYCKSYPQVRGCWKEIGASLPWRPYTSVYYRAHILYEQGERKWTPEEVELIRESYKKHGSNWKLIAGELKKWRIHVKDAFRRYKFGDLNKGHWSQQEYQNLFDLVNKDLQMNVFEEKKSKHGMLRDNISWEAISQKIGTRNNASCCQKWYRQLTSPMVAEGKWSDVDDYRLLLVLVDLDASCEEEVDWDNLLEHRSGDLCRKRWQQMVHHLGEHGNKSFSQQVEVLSKRYCPDLVEVREAMDSREVVD